MQNFSHDHLKYHSKIQAIQNSKYLKQEQKVYQISILKTTQSQAIDSSPKTIWGITNCMIGSAMIIYPILFAKSGLVISTLVMIVVATIQYLTCRLLVIHNRPDQSTYNQSILRIGGIKVDRLNSTVNMLLFFFVCVAYFILITHNFYQVSAAILESIFPYDSPESHEIVFHKYSIQWAAIISAFCIKSIVFQKQIDGLLKLAKYSIYCVASYIIFILFNLIRHIESNNIHLKQFRYFNSDFSSVAGAFALSFLVHPMAAPILKKNINLLNNSRDLLFGYVIGASICFYVGFLGALSCAPEIHNIRQYPQSYSTIFDCVQPNQQLASDRIFYFLGKVVQFAILFQNFTVMPIMLYLTRTQFLNIASRPKNKQVMFNRFTWVFIIFSTVVAMAAIDVSIILSLDGAVIGLFMGYGIPIYIHLKCLYYKFSETENRRRKSLMQSLLNQSILGQNQHELEYQPEALECNYHEPVSKMWSYSVYGLIMCCGIALGFFKLSAVFS